MIWVSRMGYTLNDEAIEAVKHGCDQVVYNGTVYCVTVVTTEAGKIDYKTEEES